MNTLRQIFVLLTFIGCGFGAEVEKDSNQVKSALAVIEKLQKSEFSEQKKMVVYNASAPEGYLRKKFERFALLKTDITKVKGDLKTRDLYAIIYEENKGDLDPIVFQITDGTMRIFISITGIRSSGLEEDKGVVSQFAEIDKYCDSLKAK